MSATADPTMSGVIVVDKQLKTTNPNVKPFALKRRRPASRRRAATSFGSSASTAKARSATAIGRQMT